MLAREAAKPTGFWLLDRKSDGRPSLRTGVRHILVNPGDIPGIKHLHGPGTPGRGTGMVVAVAATSAADARSIHDLQETLHASAIESAGVGHRCRWHDDRHLLRPGRRPLRRRQGAEQPWRRVAGHLPIVAGRPGPLEANRRRRVPGARDRRLFRNGHAQPRPVAQGAGRGVDLQQGLRADPFDGPGPAKLSGLRPGRPHPPQYPSLRRTAGARVAHPRRDRAHRRAGQGGDSPA